MEEKIKLYIEGLESFLKAMSKTADSFNKEICIMKGQLEAYRHVLELLETYNK